MAGPTLFDLLDIDIAGSAVDPANTAYFDFGQGNVAYNPNYDYGNTSGQLTWSQIGNAIKNQFGGTGFGGQLGQLAAFGGLSTLLNKMAGQQSQQPVGYQGGIPQYTATRTQTPLEQQRPEDYRPGQGGITYFNPVRYEYSGKDIGGPTSVGGGVAYNPPRSLPAVQAAAQQGQQAAALSSLQGDLSSLKLPVADEVRNLYSQIGRTGVLAPSDAEVAWWSRQGLTGDALRNAFLKSASTFTNNPVYGRAGQAAQQLMAQDVQKAAAAQYAAKEVPKAAAEEVTDLYKEIGRTGRLAPSQGEVNYWASTGLKGDDLRDAFLQSASTFAKDPVYGSAGQTAQQLLAQDVQREAAEKYLGGNIRDTSLRPEEDARKLEVADLYKQIGRVGNLAPSSAEIDYWASLGLKSDELKKKFLDSAASFANDPVYGGIAKKAKEIRGYAHGGSMPGGIAMLAGGRYLRGPGDGVSDSIPARFERSGQPARLADGEFVIDARTVSEIGNGSSEAGARKLYAMMDRVHRARKKAKRGKPSGADKFLPK